MGRFYTRFMEQQAGGMMSLAAQQRAQGLQALSGILGHQEDLGGRAALNYPREIKLKEDPKGIRAELQAETNKWLEDIK